MIILCTIVLLSDKEQTIRADIGKMIKPIPVIDRIIEVDVAPMISIECTDSNIVFTVFLFFISF